MNHYRLTSPAAEDIEEIYDYIAADNLPAAQHWIEHMTGQFIKLAETPGMGRSRSELRANLRSIAVGNYVIFYRMSASDIQIVRVLHGARDIEAMFRQTTAENE